MLEEKKERRRSVKEKEKKRRRKSLRKQKDKKKEKGKKGAVTNFWGKYGIIREIDMWFMEDDNTATFPSKKYYYLDAYYRHKMEKEKKRGFKKVLDTERTVFNDEEQRRLELLWERERQKEEQVEALKREMQSGMAQAMKEQARLKDEMADQYKLGNY